MHTNLSILVHRRGVAIALLLTIILVLFGLGGLAQAREIDSPTQSPHFAADIQGNAIHNWDWLPNTLMTWAIDGPDGDPSIDFQAQAVTDDAGWVVVFLQGWDIQPGDTIQASDGNSTQTLVVESLQVTGVDVDDDIVSGTSDAGRPVTVSAWGSSPVAATDDGAGNWQANLNGVHDIGMCSSGPAEILDVNGNATWYVWSVRCPQFSVNPITNEIWGNNWLADIPLTVEVDDYSNGSGIDLTYSPTGDSSGNFGGVDTSPYDLKSGDTVTVSGGGESKTLLVANLEVTGIDLDTETVTGTGTSGQSVAVTINTPSYLRQLTVDGFGNWTADFHQLINMEPGVGGLAYEHDDDGDTTEIWWQHYTPSISVHADDNWIEGWGWPSSDSLDVSVDGGGILATTSSGGDGYFQVQVGEWVDLQAGQHVTVSDGTYTENHIITALIVTGADAAEDTIRGTANALSDVEINVWHDPGQPPTTTTADENGNWSVDLTATDPLEPNDNGRAMQYDSEGNSTADDWHIPNPRIEAFVLDNVVEGREWPLGAQVTLTVGGYSETKASEPAPWNPNETYIWFNLSGLVDLQPGMLVTLSDGQTTKELTLTGLQITSVDYENDTVSGVTDSDLLVNLWMCNENGCANRWVEPVGGAWTADFKQTSHPWDNGTWDVNYWETIQSSQHDDEDDQTRFDWRFPILSAHPDDNWIEGWNWPNGALVTVEIDDPGTQDNPDRIIYTSGGSCPWNNDPTNFCEQLQDFDLQAGFILTAYDSINTKILVISDLVTEGVDAAQNTVWGSGTPGVEIDVWVHGQGQNLTATVDGNGDWGVDFDDLDYDLHPGESGRAAQYDDDGDNTADDWYILNPSFRVNPHTEDVWGYEFLPNSLVAILIDRHDTPWGADYITQAQTDGNGNFGLSTQGSFDIQPGDFVIITDGELTKSHRVTRLQVTEVNLQANTISGVAEYYGLVSISLHNVEGVGISLTADMDGNWTADFSSTGYTLKPGDSGWVEEHDPEGDNTHDEWRIPNPSFAAHADDNWIEGWDWPEGGVVHLEIDDPTTLDNPDYWVDIPVGTVPGDNNLSYFNTSVVDFNYDIQPGQTITISSGQHNKTLAVSSLLTLGTNVLENTIYGSAMPGTSVRVEVHNQPQYTYVDTTADENGNWTADFDLTDPPYDLKPGDNGRAHEYDLDWDSTADDWYIPNPRFEAHADDDWLEGWDWPNGVPVTIEVHIPNTSPEPDFIVNTSGGSCEWNDDPTNFCEQSLGFDLQAGMTLIASDGINTKVLEISNLVVEGINDAENTVWGSGTPGAQIDVWVHGQGQPLTAVVSGNGNWQVDFDDLGYDLQRGEGGRAAQYDGDNDGTADDWNVPNPRVQAFADYDMVEGFDWPLGAQVTVTIANYSETKTSELAPWNPNETYVQFELGGQVDLLAGTQIMLSDGQTTKELMITDLQIISADYDAETVSGTTDSGLIVQVWICDDYGCANRWVQPVNNGWTVDFSQLSHEWDNGTWDIQPMDNISSAQHDPEGDQTRDDWRLPTFAAHADEDWIEGWDWPSNQMVNIVITRPGMPEPFSGSVAPDPNDPTYFNLNLWEIFDLQPGDTVSVSSGPFTKEHLVTDLLITGMNEGNNSISGTAAANTSVRVEVFNKPQSTYLDTFVDGNGNWTADFDDIDYDLQPGENGRAWQYDLDGDSTADDWYLPNPHIVARVADELVRCWEWPIGATVFLEIEDPDTEESPDYTGQATVTEEGVADFPLAGILDLHGRQTIKATDQVTMREYVVSNLTLDNIDPDNDTLSGTADPGSWVYTAACNWEYCINRSTMTDENGNWLENFSQPGDPDEDPGMIDLVPGSNGNADQYGDHGTTRIFWYLPNPNFVVNAYNENIWGYEFLPKSEVTIWVDQYNTGWGPEFITTTQSDEYGNFWLDTGGFDIQPMDTVYVTDGTNAKSHTVTHLQVFGADAESNTVWGVAEPNGSLIICTEPDQRYCIDFTADGDGNWLVDFTETHDIGPGYIGWVEEMDTEGDRTHDEWWIPKPQFDALPMREQVRVYEWPYDSQLTLTIEDPNTPQSPDYLAYATITGCENSSWHTCVYFYLSGVFDLQPGMEVTVEGGGYSKTHTVSAITVTGIDEELDTLSGTAEPGVWVDANLNRLDTGQHSQRTVQTDENGIWIADFSTPGPNGEPVLDLRPGIEGWQRVRDNDGDTTSVWFDLLIPSLDAWPLEDRAEGGSWPGNTAIELTIDDPDTPVSPDLSQSGASDDTGYVQFSLVEAYDLQPGDQVTLTGGGLVRTHVVFDLYISAVDEANETISGKAEPGNQVSVNIYCTYQGCAQRHTQAGPDGAWQVDFSVPGPGPDEGETYDITIQTTGDASQKDAEGNQTLVGWSLPFTPWCLPGNSVSGSVFQEDGSTPIAGATVVFEDYNQPYLTLFQTTTRPDGSYACWLPDGSYRVTSGGEYYEETILENATRIDVANGIGMIEVNFTLGMTQITYDHLTFNMQDPIVSEIAVRQAIAFGTDRQRIIDATYPASPYLDSLLLPESWAYTNDGVMQYPYDPELAMKILEQAGWVLGNDGVREKDGQRLHLVYVTTTSALRKTVSEILVENMAEIGIEIQVDAMDKPWDRLNYEHDFSIAQFAWMDNPNVDNPYEMRSYLMSGNGQNTAQYNNPTADQFLDLAALYTSRAEKLLYLAHYQRTVMADLPMLLLFQRTEIPDRDGDGVPDDMDACPDQSSFGYDADLDGCLDTTTALKALVRDLRASGQITRLSTETTLLRMVVNAEAKLAAKNYSGAITDLRSFITYVQKQTIAPGKTGGTIQPEAAAKLITYTDSLIRWIGDLDNLRLGALLEYSGYDAPALVQAEDEGLRLAIEQANNAGGVLGQLVLLSQRDSSYQDDTLAQAAASDLANILNVSAILGPVTSRTTQAILESVIVPSGLMAVSPSSTSPVVGAIPDNGLLFRMADSDATRGWAAARRACSEGHDSAAIIVSGDSPWNFIDSAFRDEFASCGGTVQRTVEFYSDAGAAVRQALGNNPTNVPDLIFVAIYFDDTQLVQLVRTGVCVLGPDGLRATQHPWSFSSKLQDDFTQQVLGGISCGAAVGTQEFAGFQAIAPVFEMDFGNSAFQSAYFTQYGADPNIFANRAYDAAALLILAAEEAHSTDRALILAHLPTVASGGVPVDDLAAALSMVRDGKDIDWQGTYALQVGGISYSYNHAFQSDGETISPYAVFVLQSDGSLELAEVLEP